jgi:hypothetical protein
MCVRNLHCLHSSNCGQGHRVPKQQVLAGACGTQQDKGQADSDLCGWLPAVIMAASVLHLRQHAHSTITCQPASTQPPARHQQPSGRSASTNHNCAAPMCVSVIHIFLMLASSLLRVWSSTSHTWCVCRCGSCERLPERQPRVWRARTPTPSSGTWPGLRSANCPRLT